MAIDPIGAVIDLVNSAVTRIWPDATEEQKNKLQAELAAAQLRMSAILAEAQSSDPWTSRARPSFLYIIYLLILTSLPMAVLFAFKPDVANNVIQGFHNWLAAIPDSYLQLFGVGYLGYTGGRSWEKIKGVSK
jgi:hypothetical protein